MLEFEEVTSRAAAESWEAFLERRSDALLYHTLAWRDLLQAEYGFIPKYYLIRNGKETVGVLPLFFIANLTGRKLLSLPYSMYGGYLCDFSPAEVDAFIFSLGQTLGVRKISVWSATPDPKGILTAQPAETDSYLPITGTCEDYLAAFKSKHMNEIRKAERAGLTAASGFDQSLLDQFYHLFLQSRKEFRLPCPTKKYIKTLAALFQGELTVISDACGRAAGAGLVLRHNSKAYNVYNAIGKLGKTTNAGYLLYRRMIERAFHDGSHILYFGGSPGEHLLKFKQKWQTIQRPTFYLRQPPVPAHTGKEGIPFWNFVPNFFIPPLSHFLLRQVY